MDALKKIVAAVRDAGGREKLLALFLAVMIAVSGGAWSAYLIPHQAPDGNSGGQLEVNYSEFLGMVKEGRIASATMQADRIEAKDHDGKEVVLHHDRWLYNSTFPKDLADAGIDVRFPTPDDRTLGEWISMVSQGVFTGAMVLFLILIGAFLWMNMRGAGTAGSWPSVTKDRSVRFADVAGQAETKYELEEIKEFLQNPDAYEVTGAKPPKGVLMVGPPGTGKTLLARALAAEAGVSFIPVTGSDFSAMFVGVGRNRVERLFRKARRHAPCIIFIDEIDSLARKRGAGSTDVGREQDTTLNQLLTEMNGFKPRDGIVVIAATNRIDVLDPALLRPGRFDRHVHVNHSDMDGRREILEVHVKGKPLAADVDLGTVARGTPGFSGADLENLVNEAAILAARQRATEISPAHFEEARDKVLMGLQRHSMSLDERERKLIAVHEAGHAVVACLTEGSDPVHQATIVPRGRSLGLVMRLPERDRISVPLSKLRADLDVLMAGRAAEEIVFGPEDVTTGAASDIEEATKLAKRMVAEWGMSAEVGMVRVLSDDGKIPQVAEAEVRRTIDEAYRRASELLKSRRDRLDDLAAALLQRSTLDGGEVRQIVVPD